MNLHGVLNKGQSRLRVRRGAAMVAAVGVAMLGGITVASTASATADITICHRTASGAGGNAHNGYNAQPVDAHSIVMENGHDSHDQVSNGPGGDIIPAFNYGDGQHYDGKNLGWGQAWLDNGCNAPTSAHLTLVKKVVNKGGGTAKRTDWTLNAAGPTPFHGKISVGRDVAAGDYTLSETGPSGYTASAWDCENGELSRTSVVAPTVTVREGDNVTCTITNTFTPPEKGSLTLVKEVVNTGGGTATASDWTLTAAGPTPFQGTTPVSNEVVAGDYTLSETGPLGYTASAWDCGNAEFSGIAKVIVGKDEKVTCTITNTFIPYGTHKALLTLKKSVNNSAGGSALATAWTLDATGGPTAFAEGTTGVHQKVADGTYTLSESGTPANYSASAWVCTRPEEVDRSILSSSIVSGNTVVIGPNDTAVTCTITNTFVPTTVDRTPVTPPVFTPGTCFAAGSVVAPDTSAYTWMVTGLETARSYEAVAKPGVTLIGTRVFGPFDLSQLASQSVDPAGACYVAPPPTIVPTTPSPVVGGVVKDAPVVAGVVKSAPVKTLAFTGAEPVPLGLSGLIALVLGVVLTVASRRQRPKQVRE